MLKPLAWAMLMAAIQPAYAATWSYDFSGHFDDHFDLISDVGVAVATQSDGRFIYSFDSYDTAGDGPELVHKGFMPTFGQSWWARIDASIPLSLDTLPNDRDWYMEVGLAVGHVTSGNTRFASYGLEIGNMANLSGTDPARKYLGEYYVNDVDVWDDHPGDPVRNTGLETVTLNFSFNNQSKILTASANQYGPLFSVDTNDWGMKNADKFIFIPFMSAEGHTVPAITPLAFDNFNAQVFDNPPGTVVQNFLGQDVNGNLLTQQTSYSAYGIAQQVAQGVFGQPDFLVPGDYLQVFDVEYTGTLVGPVELTFAYDADLLPSGFDEANLRVFHWTGTEWENLGGVVDAANNTITVTTSSLSPFAVAAVPEPQTYALMLAGLGLVGFAARRRKQS